jgi:hypothetical protein
MHHRFTQLAAVIERRQTHAIWLYNMLKQSDRLFVDTNGEQCRRQLEPILCKFTQMQSALVCK